MKQLSLSEIINVSGGLIYLGYDLYMPHEGVSPACVDDLNVVFAGISNLLVDGIVSEQRFAKIIKQSTRCKAADAKPLMENSQHIFMIGKG